MAENGGGRKEQSWLDNLQVSDPHTLHNTAHGAWRDMQLQTDNSGSVMFGPCVPPGTERIKVKVVNISWNFGKFYP